MVAVTDLDIATLEKLEPGRNRAEEIAHRHDRPLRCSCRRHLRNLSVDRSNLCSLCRATMITDQSHLGNSCNARQRLATKAKRTDMLQIIDLRYLARGVSRQCQRKLVHWNTGTIISDTNKLQSPINKIYTNLCSSCINAILD